MTTLQTVIAFLFTYRFPLLLVVSFGQLFYIRWLRRRLKLYTRWYQSQQTYYQPQQQQQYRQW